MSILKQTPLWILLLFVALLSSGCYDPTTGKVDAGSSEAKKVKAVSITQSEQVTPLDADNTDVKWTGSNSAGLSPFGYFYELSGQAVFSADTKDWKQIEFTIEMESVRSDNSDLTKKLKYKGFFEVDTYPQATFVSTNIAIGPRAGDPEGTTHVIEANFQLRDVTKSIQIPVRASFTAGQFKLSSEFKLNRKDYGVVYSDSTGDALIRDDVLMNIEIETKMPSARE